MIPTDSQTLNQYAKYIVPDKTSNINHWEILTTATGFILGGVSYSIANLILERKSKSNVSKNGHINGSDRKIPSDSKPASGRSLSLHPSWTTYPKMQRLELHLLQEAQ